MDIGIIGSNGFLGKNLIFNFKNYNVTGITKDNYNSLLNYKFDILINSNGNSKKFWANKHPQKDFILSSYSVYKSLFDFQCDRYIYISSLDVYKNNVYGFNKKLAEQIIKKFHKKYIILRCSSIIGNNMKKGVLYDILSENKLFLTSNSKLQFISCEDIFNTINNLIKLNVYKKTFNLCGIKNISIKELGNLLHKNIIYNTELEKQYFNYNSKEILKYYKIKTTKEYIKEYYERMD